MSVWYPTLRRLASLRKRFNTSGSKRMAISRRAPVPIGGRPTRRIALSCRSDVSGISEKSIPRRVTIRRPFLPARPPRTDDADRFDMACCPLRIRLYHKCGRARTYQDEEIELLPPSGTYLDHPMRRDPRTPWRPHRTRRHVWSDSTRPSSYPTQTQFSIYRKRRRAYDDAPPSPAMARTCGWRIRRNLTSFDLRVP